MNSTHHTKKSLCYLADSALAPYIDAYIAHLKCGRYADCTIDCYLACLAHFAQWMQQSHLDLCHLDKTSITNFLDEHLPHCNCTKPAVQTRSDLHTACIHLLVVLRSSGVIPEPSLGTDPIDEEMQKFDAYLRDARGLTDKTRRQQRRIVRQFLFTQFGKHDISIGALRPTDVQKFISSRLPLKATVSNAKAVTSSLRSYFRYRTICGDHVLPLLGVIASPAHWSLASLPRALSADEIKRLLDAFPPDLPSFRRGYAMMRCALDLGLRSSEIANLALADIDWQRETITIRHNKSRREDCLPMPVSTGEAMADYLRFERPTSTNHSVFVRIHAPHDVPISSDVVSKVIRKAYHRVGILHGSTHALRHTLARRMLEHGSSLKEIADVLRHRSLNTSLIYAKLDNRSLIGVALPWPGSAT